MAKEIAKSGYDGSLMLETSKLSRYGGAAVYEEMTDEEYCQRAAASLNKLKHMIEQYRRMG